MKKAKALLKLVFIICLLTGPVATASSPGGPHPGFNAAASAETGSQREPRAARKARLKQEAKDRQLKKDYEQFVKNNRKRSVEIQSPEVQERMKQNVKDANAKYKAKKKTNKSRTRSAGRKYR